MGDAYDTSGMSVLRHQVSLKDSLDSSILSHFLTLPRLTHKTLQQMSVEDIVEFIEFSLGSFNDQEEHVSMDIMICVHIPDKFCHNIVTIGSVCT